MRLADGSVLGMADKRASRLPYEGKGSILEPCSDLTFDTLPNFPFSSPYFQYYTPQLCDQHVLL
jgi:hypothetical protein